MSNPIAPAPVPSNWQQRIEGEWHGRPSVFDATGAHQGYSKVYRASTYENGRTLYTMNTKFEVAGALQPRLEYGDFAFDVRDSDQNRIYLGPDFYGAGQPYGSLVDAHYYSPGWMADLRTLVHILPDGQTQCYSSLLYQGPTILCVFNGLYKVAFDYQTNPDTRAFIDNFVGTEVVNGPRPHILPTKQAGRWTGEMQVYDADQNHVGVNHVTIDYRPVNLLRAEQTVTIEGVVNRQMNFTRHRTGNLHAYEGPDVYGNGFGYGRALYTTQHVTNEAVKIKGREFLIDDQYSLSAVWQFYKGDKQTHMTYGVLTWAEA